jgi:transcriptional regulator with XRE-family HTH domain
MRARALVAWNLRRIRVALGLSQEKLAFDSGIDRAYLGGIERETQNPTVDTLDRLSEVLDVEVADFFRAPAAGEEPPKPLKAGRRPN